MNTQLSHQKCVPCEGGTKPFDSSEIATYMSYLKTPWDLDDENKKIKKEYKFKDFKQAMQFINKVAEIAESEGHHPDIKISYNKVKIILWTHAIGGLSVNDFILASKIEQLSL